MSSDGLEVRTLRLARGGKPVLHDVDLRSRAARSRPCLAPMERARAVWFSRSRARCLRPAAKSFSTAGRSRIWPELVRSRGVAAVPEGHHVLNDLTVEDNLKVSGSHLSRADLKPAIARALETFPELRERMFVRAGAMSGGQQQMLALAQAIISQPKYLLADELSFGLAPVIVARLVPVLQSLASQGVGVLLIEQFTHIALKIADFAYVMERGRICFSGQPQALIENPEILHGAYLS